MIDHLVIRVDSELAERFFEYAGYRARHVRDPLNDLGDWFDDEVAAAFESEATPEGRPWQELSRKYEEWKVKTHGLLPKLVLDGVLRPLAEKSTYVADDRLEYFVDLPYAGIQHDGGVTDFNHRGDPIVIPARRWTPRRHAVEAQADEVFTNWLEDIKYQAGAPHRAVVLEHIPAFGSWL